MNVGRPERSLPLGKPEQLTQTALRLAMKLSPPVARAPNTGTALRPTRS